MMEDPMRSSNRPSFPRPMHAEDPMQPPRGSHRPGFPKRPKPVFNMVAAAIGLLFLVAMMAALIAFL